MTSQLGYTTVGSGGTDQNGSGVIVVSGAFTTDALGGLVGSGWARFNGLSGSGSRSQKVRLVIYGSGATAPNNVLVGVTDEVTVDETTANNTWIEFPGWTHFGGAPTLAPLTKYWVGMWFGTQVNSALWNIDFDVSAPNEQAFDDTSPVYSSTANPAAVTLGQPGNTDEYSLYFDYAPAGPVKPRYPQKIHSVGLAVTDGGQ